MAVSEFPGAGSGPGARVDELAAAAPFPPMKLPAAASSQPGDVIRRLPEIDLEADYQQALTEIDYLELGDLISPVEARRRRSAAYAFFNAAVADLRAWLMAMDC